MKRFVVKYLSLIVISAHLLNSCKSTERGSVCLNCLSLNSNFQNTPLNCIQRHLHYKEIRNIDSFASTVDCELYLRNDENILIEIIDETDLDCSVFIAYTELLWSVTKSIWQSKANSSDNENELHNDIYSKTITRLDRIKKEARVLVVDMNRIYYLHQKDKTWLIFKEREYVDSNSKAF